MNPFFLLAMATAVGAPSYQIDLGRYFPDKAAEQSQRESLLERTDIFVKTPVSTLSTPQAISAWLSTYEGLLAQLQKHEVYVYLLAEENSEDHAAEAADGALVLSKDRVDASVESKIATLGLDRLKTLMASDPSLASYRYFIELTLNRSVHATQNAEVVSALAEPALRSLGESYMSLLPARMTAVSGEPKAGFDAKWLPFAQNEAAFAAVLIPIVRLHNGKARLEGYPDAAEAAYAASNLTGAQVDRVLSAIRRTDAAKRYEAVVAAAAARRLAVPVSAIHAWNLQAADSYRPTSIAFPKAIPLILAAEKSMGEPYAEQYAHLFEPQAIGLSGAIRSTAMQRASPLASLA